MTPFLTANLRWLAAGFLLLFCGCFGQTFVVALSGGAIRRDFGLSDGAFGALYAGVTLASALALAGLGGLIDRWPAPRVVSLAAGLLAAGAAGLALSPVLAPSLLVLAPSLFLLRFAGQGLMLQTAYTLMGRWFSAERGRAVSLAALGLNAGQACLPLGFVTVAALLGWRGAWLGIALLLVLVALPLARHLVRRERVPEATTGSGPAEGATRAQALADPYLYGLLAAMLPPSFISNTIFFHQVHLAESRGWPPEMWAAAFPPYAVAAFLCLLLAGRLVDRYSALALLPLYLVPFGLACLILGGVSAPWAAFAFMLLYGVTDGISLTLFGALWPEVYGTRHLGAVRGAIVAIMVLGTALGPVLSGLLIDAGVPFAGIVTGMGIYCLGISGALGLVRRRMTAHLRGRRFATA
ncbi:Predicted arabinose efflux permease, MFS family [Methylobacterium sp. 174MFSha1.1]|uniref:MFS transporter n=1 Tax=Methylobacterium sp. 174MFSha1.1 TaxID=1502749 RepID=UPI0008EAF7E6|nr:MFS transporter [Methylobacterium sp. 174MFSha1.1]SFU41128.1 Predicted arabinose efflux permease, MFS family [Methylobacterium sp. 174MFSha1.1]